ncbi:MAG: PGPGW domain-containing protein [Candidatus Acidiferrales bacterium]
MASASNTVADAIADQKSDRIREEVEEEMIIKTLQQAKRILRIVFGFTLLGLGIIMIFTPFPGWLTILLALGVLAAEFVWARRLLDRLKEQGTRIRDTVFPRTDRVA